MMRLFTAAAAFALISGVAVAQTTTTTTTTPSATTTMTNPAAPPAAVNDPSATSTNPATTPSATSMGVETAGVVPMSSQPPEVQATLKAGDPNVVSNPPVADTPENRAKYGAPMSNAGKRTAPKGN